MFKPSVCAWHCPRQWMGDGGRVRDRQGQVLLSLGTQVSQEKQDGARRGRAGWGWGVPGHPGDWGIESEISGTDVSDGRQLCQEVKGLVGGTVGWGLGVPQFWSKGGPAASWAQVWLGHLEHSFLNHCITSLIPTRVSFQKWKLGTRDASGENWGPWACVRFHSYPIALKPLSFQAPWLGKDWKEPAHCALGSSWTRWSPQASAPYLGAPDSSSVEGVTSGHLQCWENLPRLCS